MVEYQFMFLVTYKRNAIRDGGSTALYAAYTVDTVVTVYTFDTVDIVTTVDMVYTAHC